MRRFITVSLSAVFVLGLFVGVGSAQFRRGARPPQMMMPSSQPMLAFPGSFGPPMFSGGPMAHTRGTFTSTGAFVPSATGPFVSSLHNRFEPTPGTFATASGNVAPSSVGQSIATRQAFASTSGTAGTPAKITVGNSFRGDAFAAVGTTAANRTFPVSGISSTSPFNALFTAGSTSAFSRFNPYNPYNPFNNAFGSPTTSGSPLTNPLLYAARFNNPYFYGNPYFASPYGYYGYANPYFASPYGYGFGGYGYPAYGYGGYGYPAYGNYSGVPYAGAYGAMPVNAPGVQVAGNGAGAGDAKQPMNAALPTDDGQWPLAFRMMSPTKKGELLDPLEGQLRSLKKQADNDKVTPWAVRDAKESVENLRIWLRSRRVDLAEGTYDEANTFLRRLDRTISAMKY